MSNMTQTAADLFTTSAAEIVTRTGCTVDQALSYLLNKMADERPELLAKVILTAPCGVTECKSVATGTSVRGGHGEWPTCDTHRDA